MAWPREQLLGACPSVPSGGSWDEGSLENQRTVRQGELAGSCSSLLWATPPPSGKAPTPEAGCPLPSSTLCLPTSIIIMRLRGWGPQCAGPALSQPTQRLHLPSPVALSSVWPCQGPLLWALSSPTMAPQRKSPAVLPTAPPAPQQASPLSGSPLGVPITPDPAAPQRVLLS